MLAANHITTGETLQDSQASLQANKAAFFFRLERELEKVNTFYLQKEAEVRKASIRSEAPVPNLVKSSSSG